MRLVVVGSINEDLLLRVPKIPAPGETVSGEDLERAPGGKGANQAVAAARLGADVSLVARVGADPSGSALLARLRQEGVDVEAVGVDTDAATGTALIVVEPGGENTVTVAPGANARLTPEDVRRAAPTGQAAPDAVVAVLEVPVVAVTAAFAAAGPLRVLNAAPIGDPQALRDLLASCDVLVVNESEALTLLTLAPDLTAAGWELRAAALRGLGPATVVVTLGSAGAAWADSTAHGSVRGFRVDALDAVGAGDTFVAALTVALASRRPTDAAVGWACAAAALATLARGAQNGMPRHVEVDELVAGRAVGEGTA